ncbi:MAG: hybrid sensor histidine kinase/response regulator [Anaerolineae bacterium]|nr:hybrid sensor histidine kinase/response regulator [Anaerolineae bacterium]
MEKALCILIVDDDDTLRELLHDLLIKDGYKVLTAANGQEALAEMDKQRPDAIIADIMMPNMDGYSFYEAVRQKQEWVSIPFIFLTAKGEHEDIMRGKAMGAEDYLLKPFSSRDLLIILQARLKRSAAIQTAMKADTNQLKEQIIGILGHELRTPLTFISGYTDLALANAALLPNQEFRKFLMGIKYGSDRLMKLIMDLLMVFEIQSNIVAQNFDAQLEDGPEFKKLITEIVEEHQQEAQQKGVQLDVQLPENLPPVHIDHLLFHNALGRLVSNGIKFTATDNGHVSVTAETSSDQVKILISDNGVGMTQEEVAMLFEPFRQINRDEMEQQGLGIGLYIAQQLIQLHKGDICVNSRPGFGSRFAIQLPQAGAH